MSYGIGGNGMDTSYAVFLYYLHNSLPFKWNSHPKNLRRRNLC